MPSEPAATHLIHCIVDRMPDTAYLMVDAGLSIVQYRDIAAIAREVDAKGVKELVRISESASGKGGSETRSWDNERLRNWLLAYQQTNIDIFRHGTMLPLRFGTMVDRKEEMEDFLSKSYIHLKWALDKLRGKAEFAVQISWDLDAVLQEISRDEQWLDRVSESIDLARTDNHPHPNLPPSRVQGRTVLEECDNLGFSSCESPKFPSEKEGLSGIFETSLPLKIPPNPPLQKGGTELSALRKGGTGLCASEPSRGKAMTRCAVPLQEKVQIGRLLFQTADIKKREIVESVHRKLIAVSLDSSEGRSADTTDRDVCPTIRDLCPIIMNRSYLIERAAEGAFDQAMAELARENESYLNIKYVGPIPPYSFAPLEFKRGNFELIDEARRRLLLSERAGLEEVKSSYRKLSLRYHPDKNAGDEQSSERFRQIEEAYRILETYCCSFDVSLASRKTQAKACYSGEDVTYSFTRDDVERVFIVERALSR